MSVLGMHLDVLRHDSVVIVGLLAAFIEEEGWGEVNLRSVYWQVML